MEVRKESRLIQVKRADCEVYNILFEMTISVKHKVPNIIFLQLHFAPCLKCFFSLAYGEQSYAQETRFNREK